MKIHQIGLLLVTGPVSSFIIPSSNKNGVCLSSTSIDSEVKATLREAGSESQMQSPVEIGMDSKDTTYSVDRIVPGRFDGVTKSIAIPFLPRPAKLDGSHAGDFGFDPVGYSETQDLYFMQECELRHARLAMLAVVGWPLSELLAPDWMLQDGMAPSVLNGFNPVSFLGVATIFAALGFFEYKTAFRQTVDTKLGDIHREDMKDVWDNGVAGDYNFDPLDLYFSLGDEAYARKGLRDVEISHGRSAMLGITAFVIWEKLTGHPIVEDSIFFHPNAILPLLGLVYLFVTDIYKVSDLAEYPIRIEYTSEGEAKLNRIKDGIGKSTSGANSDSNETLQKISDFNEQFGVTDKISKATSATVKAVKGTYKYW